MGFGPRQPRDLGPVAPALCPNCGNHVDFHLFEMRNWFRLFFVPVVPGRARHAVICPVCRYGIETSDAALAAARELIGLNSTEGHDAVAPALYRQKIDAFWSMLGGERLADPYDARPSRGQPASDRPAPRQPAPNPPAGWYVDPFGEADQRYWDGERWTAGTNPPEELSG